MCASNWKALIGGCLFLGLVAQSALAAGAVKPNIIFLLTDDMGYGDAGCYGGKFAPTPNIDRLATEGTRFTQFYVASPVCSPSRAAFLTGMFPARWRITSYLQTRAGNRKCEQADFLDPKAPSIARSLKAAGYVTGHFGKWHMGGGRDVTDTPLPKDAPFDGEDLSDSWLGRSVARRKPLFWEYGRNNIGFDYPRNPRDHSPNVALREGKWKLLINADGSGVELYDLEADRNETTNVAGANTDIAKRLGETALQWRKSLP